MEEKRDHDITIVNILNYYRGYSTPYTRIEVRHEDKESTYFSILSTTTRQKVLKEILGLPVQEWRRSNFGDGENIKIMPLYRKTILSVFLLAKDIEGTHKNIWNEILGLVRSFEWKHNLKDNEQRLLILLKQIEDKLSIKKLEIALKKRLEDE